jgi:hypothetical protein
MCAPVKDRRCEASPLLGAMAAKDDLMRRTKHGVSAMSIIRLYYKLLPPQVYSVACDIGASQGLFQYLQTGHQHADCLLAGTDIDLRSHNK